MYTSEMWPRIHTPLLGFSSAHTPCLAQLTFTFNCCCYSQITSQRLMGETTIICGGSGVGEEHLSVTGAQCKGSILNTLQRNNLRNTNFLSEPGFEFESSFLQGLLQEPATRGCVCVLKTLFTAPASSDSITSPVLCAVAIPVSSTRVILLENCNTYSKIRD